MKVWFVYLYYFLLQYIFLLEGMVLCPQIIEPPYDPVLKVLAHISVAHVLFQMIKSILEDASVSPKVRDDVSYAAHDWREYHDSDQQNDSQINVLP